MRFGTTSVIYDEKTMTLAELIPTIRSTLRGSFTIKTMKITEDHSLGSRRFLEKLTLEKDRWHFLTHKLLRFDLDDLLHLRGIADKLPKNTRDRATEALELVMIHKYKYRYQVDITLKITYSKQINKRALLTQVKRIIKQSDIPAPITKLLLQPSQIKIVHTKTPSIRQQTTNYKQKICNNFDPDNPPKCTCTQSILLNKIWDDDAFCEITYDSGLRTPGTQQRQKGGPIRENTDMKTEKHLAWKTTDLKKMIEKKRKEIQTHRNATDEYERLMEVAELMQMSSSNIPAPSFIDDIANVETMLMDLTNKLVATMEKQIFPTIQIHAHNTRWYTIVFSERKGDQMHIQANQLQFLWDTYRHQSDEWESFLKQLRIISQQLQMGDTSYQSQRFLPRDLTTFCMKHLNIDTEHSTNRLHMNRMAIHTSQGNMEHFYNKDPTTFEIQWDTNSIGLYMGNAQQAIEFATCSQLIDGPTGRDLPSHILIVPQRTLTTRIRNNNTTHNIWDFPIGTLIYESTHQKCIYGQVDDLEEQRNTETMSMIVISSNVQWLDNLTQKIPRIRTVLKDLTGFDPIATTATMMDTDDTYNTDTLKKHHQYTQLPLLSTRNPMTWTKEDTLTKLILHFNLIRLKVENPNLLIAGLEQISNEQLDDEPQERTREPIQQSTIDDYKRFFGHLVVSELDKNNGASFVCCPVYYFQHLKKAYTLDTHYQHIDSNKEIIFKKWKADWEKISPK